MYIYNATASVKSLYNIYEPRLGWPIVVKMRCNKIHILLSNS